MNSDEVKMDVNIAGERISLSVPFSRQEAVRKTEYELSALLRQFGETFPKKSPKELLAMVAYKFASSYFDLIGERKDDCRQARSLLDEAVALCGDSKPDEFEASDDEFPLY